jgi:HK97 family phage major capsid protein
LSEPIHDSVELEKKFMELLATRDTDNLNVLIPEVLSGISPVPRMPIIGREIVDVDTSILGKPGRSVVYIKESMDESVVPRRLTMYDPYKIPEGAQVPETHEEIEYITAIPEKFGKRPMVTKELIEDAQWDVIARNTSLVMTAAKEFEDKEILNTLFTGALSSNAITTGTADTLALSEIREAMKYMAQIGWRPTDIIVNPAFWESMMAYSWATTTGETTSQEWKSNMFRSGNVPPVFGIPVTMTPLLEDDADGNSRAMIISRKVCGILTLKRDWTLEAISDPLTDTQGVILTARFATSVLHPSAVVPITSK